MSGRAPWAGRSLISRGNLPSPSDALVSLIPVAFTASPLLGALTTRFVASDFHVTYYPAVQRLLEGGSPYAWTPSQMTLGRVFTNPPFMAVVLAPLALLGQSVSDHLYLLLCVALIPAAVWAAGPSDRRTYAIPLLWLPAVVGWEGGNVSVPLTFLVALAWRYRSRPVILGLLVAVAISLKTFLWPLGLWLLATRRWRAAAWALVSGAMLNLCALALVGFSSINGFLQVCRETIDGHWRTGYSMFAIGSHLGLDRASAGLLLLAATTILVLVLVRRGSGRGHERETMALTVALILVASPMVWSHYFVLLIVPVALAQNRFGALWLLPAAMWVCPVTTPSGWQLVLAWAVAAACIGAACRWPVDPEADCLTGLRSADRSPHTEAQTASPAVVGRARWTPGAEQGGC